MAKLLCNVLEGDGERHFRSLTTVKSVVATLVKTTPGIGQPFWYFDSIPPVPPGYTVTCDFTAAPLATSSTTTNNGLIAEMADIDPMDVLTYTPPADPGA